MSNPLDTQELPPRPVLWSVSVQDGPFQTYVRGVTEYCEEMERQLRDALARLSAMEKENQYISVDQELPEDGERVLVWKANAEREHIATYEPTRYISFPWRDQFNGGDGYSISHWRPLPAPPREALVEQVSAHLSPEDNV